MTNQLRTLIGKLNRTCRIATESAANSTVARGHLEIELEHFWLAMGDQEGTDLPLLCRAFGVDPAVLAADLSAQLAAHAPGHHRTPVFSQALAQLLERSWLIASLESPQTTIRGAHLLTALLTDSSLRQMAIGMSRQFECFDTHQLRHRASELLAESMETEAYTSESGRQTSTAGRTQTGEKASPSLDRYTFDLTAEAAAGRIDPVIGRETEIRQLLDVLMRRRQNNPILTGEAGVGKTAVVEGLARRICASDVPPALQNVSLRRLDLTLLQAGAGVKGEFESRLNALIEEIRNHARPIILFIDEAHGLIGAGAAAGQGDAANILKPALARGELRTIAATTWAEYKRYFEKDAALARRFQVVQVDEPDEDMATHMLRAMVHPMREHFGVNILDEAVRESVRLSSRYITGKQLPDKAVSLLDTACAQVALAQTATPARMDDLSRAIQRIELEITQVAADAGNPVSGDTPMLNLEKTHRALKDELAALESRYRQEQAIVQALLAGRDSAHGPAVNASADADKLRAELGLLQAKDALIPLEVSAQVVASVVSQWTGIPLGRMLTDEIDATLQLESQLEERILGQPQALKAVAQRIRTSKAGLEDPGKPTGVFLFAGPSGVGKTETALALAEALYGGESRLITLNMSEFQESHTVAGLKGSPPGYVGYGQGGILTEAVRRNPYSVVLLDEIEKAHPDVLELFYQVFDKGVLDDGEGRRINFRNCLLILTSNTGSGELMSAALSGATTRNSDPFEQWVEMIRPSLNRQFKPAFLGRVQVIPFLPLDDEQLVRVVKLKLKRLAVRYQTHHGYRLRFSAGIAKAVLTECAAPESGARRIDHVVADKLLPGLSHYILKRISESQPLQDVQVTVSRRQPLSFRFSAFATGSDPKEANSKA
jgi:type VI secretion system protein VasG